jgi:hypothetical protein
MVQCIEFEITKFSYVLSQRDEGFYSYCFPLPLMGILAIDPQTNDESTAKLCAVKANNTKAGFDFSLFRGFFL